MLMHEYDSSLLETSSIGESASAEELLAPFTVGLLSGNSIIISDLCMRAQVGDLLAKLAQLRPLPEHAIYRLVVGTELLHDTAELKTIVENHSILAVGDQPSPFYGTWVVHFDNGYLGWSTWTINEDQIIYEDPSVNVSCISERKESKEMLSFVLSMTFDEQHHASVKCHMTLRPGSKGELISVKVANGEKMIFRMVRKDAMHTAMQLA